ncbi:ANTAR domain-containing protein [Geodermatophilus sp. SYSU D01186]
MSNSADPPAGRPSLQPHEALTRLADLEVAHEELRVAEEELRVQQEQIAVLLAGYEAERRWRTHLSATVPVALCVTDGAGRLLDANRAMADVLHVPLHRLRGKPLSVYLGAGDAQAFRTAVGDLAGRGATERRLRVTLRSRRSAEEPAELFGFPDTGGVAGSEPRVQWVVLAGSARMVDDEVAPLAGDVSAVDAIGVASALAELSALPIDDDDRTRLLTRMAVLVRGAVPSATGVSITIGSPAEPQQLGSDSALAQEFDGRQLEAEQGPCWEAHVRGAVVVTPDVATDERWPRLRDLPGDPKVRAVLAIPLREGEQAVGVLNVYAEQVGVFGQDGRRIAELVAAVVGGVLQSATERAALQTLAANLEKALTSRAVIDQAKGVLMAHLGVDADEAFARLVALSNRHNVKLRDLAQLVVTGHADEVVAAARRSRVSGRSDP